MPIQSIDLPQKRQEHTMGKRHPFQQMEFEKLNNSSYCKQKGFNIGDWVLNDIVGGWRNEF